MSYCIGATFNWLFTTLTPAVVIGVFLLIVIRAQDLLVLLWEGGVRLARLRAASPTMRLWSEWGDKQR